MRVRLSAEAREFLRSEVQYLRERSPAAARRLLDKIAEARKNLGDYPSMGPIAEDELIPGVRRLVVGDYVLSYSAAHDLIEIYAIRHGRMQEPGADVYEDFDYEAATSLPKP